MVEKNEMPIGEPFLLVIYFSISMWVSSNSKIDINQGGGGMPNDGFTYKGGGGVKNFKKNDDVFCDRPLKKFISAIH